MKNADYWIDKLELHQHPEGGWYKEVYRSKEKIPANALPERYGSDRNHATAIYYMLKGEENSAFHRIKSDEIWNFHTGSSALELLWIQKGNIHRALLGPSFEDQESFQVVIPRNCWFAARLVNSNGFALMSCVVAPGFDFADFELADPVSLVQEFPGLKQVMESFYR